MNDTNKTIETTADLPGFGTVRLSVVLRKLGPRRRPRAPNSRVYIWPEKESVLENLVNRRDRPVKLYKIAAEAALSVAMIAKTSLRWSQKAGCGCGCSPGFVAGRPLFHTDSFVDVHVTIGSQVLVLCSVASDVCKTAATLADSCT